MHATHSFFGKIESLLFYLDIEENSVEYCLDRVYDLGPYSTSVRTFIHLRWQLFSLNYFTECVKKGTVATSCQVQNVIMVWNFHLRTYYSQLFSNLACVVSCLTSFKIKCLRSVKFSPKEIRVWEIFNEGSLTRLLFGLSLLKEVLFLACNQTHDGNLQDNQCI